MKDLTFQQIEETINTELSKNYLKPAVSISVEAQMRKNDAFKSYFSVAIYQIEKNLQGSTIFHYFHCDSIASLKRNLKASILEKNQ